MEEAETRGPDHELTWGELAFCRGMKFKTFYCYRMHKKKVWKAKFKTQEKWQNHSF
jgi:hypothetical protein